MTFQERLDEYLATLRKEIESCAVRELNERPDRASRFRDIVSTSVMRVNKSDEHKRGLLCLFCGCYSTFTRCIECSKEPVCTDCGNSIPENTKLRCGRCSSGAVAKTHHEEAVYLNDRNEVVTEDGTMIGKALQNSEGASVEVNLDLSKFVANCEKTGKSNMLGRPLPPTGVFVDELGQFVAETHEPEKESPSKSIKYFSDAIKKFEKTAYDARGVSPAELWNEVEKTKAHEFDKNRCFDCDRPVVNNYKGGWMTDETLPVCTVCAGPKRSVGQCYIEEDTGHAANGEQRVTCALDHDAEQKKPNKNGDVFPDEKLFTAYPRKVHAEFLPPDPSGTVPEIELDPSPPQECNCGAEPGHVPGGIHCRR